MYKFNGINFTDSDNDPGKNKETIVFLHGFFMDHRMFKHQVEYFKSHYRVICCDLRGFGETQWNEGVFTLEELARDILDLLKHLHISNFVVAGMSMGGYVAQRMAIMEPDSIQSLILIATQASSDNPETIKSYHQLRDNWGNIAAREEIIDGLLPVIIGENEEESAFWKDVWLSYQPENIYYPMIAMTSRTEIEVLQIKMPCFVIHGSDDIGIPLLAGETLHKRLPHSEMLIVDMARHAVNLTHSAIVNQGIERFLLKNKKEI